MRCHTPDVPTYNVAVLVVSLVNAASERDAIEALSADLLSADFDLHADGLYPNAFLSETSQGDKEL